MATVMPKSANCAPASVTREGHFVLANSLVNTVTLVTIAK